MAGDSIQGISTAAPGDGVLQLQQPNLRAALRAFILSGRTDKQTAESLWSFCREERGLWIHPNNNGNNNDHNNNAAPLTSPASSPTASPGLSASSSSSSQNPPTRPQTPTSDHGHAHPQQYRLDNPRTDYIELRTFLLRLLVPAEMVDRRKVQELYDLSSLPGHGTQAGFVKLVEEAAYVPAATRSPSGKGHSWTGNSVLKHHSPSFQAQHPLEAQDNAFRAHQQSHSFHQVSHDFVVKSAHIPNLSLTPQQLAAHMQHPPMAPGLEQQQHSGSIHLQAFQESRDHSLAQAALGQSQMDNNSAPSFGPPQVPSQQAGNDNTAGSPTANAQTSPPTKIRRISRQKEEMRLTSIADAPPKASAPKQSKNAASKGDDKKQPEISECTILLVNGQRCAWTLTGDKAYKTGLDHIREHHPHKFNEQLEKLLGGTKAAFEAMVHNHEMIQCSLNKKGTSEKCLKACAGEQMYRSLIEHVRRAHCDSKDRWQKEFVTHIKLKNSQLATTATSLKSNRETLELICERYWELENLQAPAMELSASNHSASSGHSAGSSLHQHRASQDAPMHSPSIPVPAINNISPRQVQQFNHAAAHYGPNGCVPPAALQMGQMGQMEQMSQHDDVYSMGYSQQADSSLYNPQGSDVPLALRFSPPSRVQDNHRQSMVMGMAMQGSALQHTLRPPLFQGHDTGLTGHQQYGQITPVPSVGLQQAEYNAHQLPSGQIGLSGQQVPQGMVNGARLTVEDLNRFSQPTDPSSRKRERDDLEEDQGSPSKRMSTWTQHGHPSMGNHHMQTAPPQAISPQDISPQAISHPAISGVQISSNDPTLGDASPLGALIGSDPGFYDDQHGHPSNASLPPVDDVDTGDGLPAYDFPYLAEPGLFEFADLLNNGPHLE